MHISIESIAVTVGISGFVYSAASFFKNSRGIKQVPEKEEADELEEPSGQEEPNVTLQVFPELAKVNKIHIPVKVKSHSPECYPPDSGYIIWNGIDCRQLEKEVEPDKKRVIKIKKSVRKQADLL